jgi:hypothetical protein
MVTILVENSSTKINKLIDIDNEYVDNINTDSVNTVDNILSHLDPFCLYSPSEQTSG